NRLLDMDSNEREFKELIEGMGFGYDGQVLIPPYRTDIMNPIDIVEEVAIKHGYQNFEPRIPRVPTIAKPHPLIEYSEKIANLICGFGFQEVIGMVLTNEVDLFDRMRVKRKPVAKTENPINENYNVCRSWLLPSLMRVLKQNRNRAYPQRIFEIGDVVIPDKNEETGIRMERRLAVCHSDTTVDYSELASILDSLLRNLGFECKLLGKDHPSFIKSRSAEIIVEGKKIGMIGELHPEVLENWNLEKPVVGFEIDVTYL
ncbi:MAG: phenylalanine--tRNA ligase subunit beta, partial [Candidatus Aenigmatarchaeota archaeon]